MTDWYAGFAKSEICIMPDCTDDHNKTQAEYKLMKYKNLSDARKSLQHCLDKVSGDILMHYGFISFIDIMDASISILAMVEEDFEDKVWNPQFGNWVFVLMNKLPEPEEDIHYTIVADHTNCTDDKCEAIYYDDPAKQN